MTDKDIERMNFKELRSEVQLLRDELARMKRSFEDTLNNLTLDNFSGQFVREQNGMKLGIKATEEGMSAVVTEVNGCKEQVASFEQTAEGFKTEVKKYTEDINGKIKEQNSKLEQTAEKVAVLVTEATENGETKYSLSEQTAALISQKVKSEAEAPLADAKGAAEAAQNSAEEAASSASEITQTAESIKMRVEKTFNVAAAVVTEDKPNDNSSDFDADKLYVMRRYNEDGTTNETYYYHDGEGWRELTDTAIYSLFEQTAKGFNLRGDVRVRGGLTVTGSGYSSNTEDGVLYIEGNDGDIKGWLGYDETNCTDIDVNHNQRVWLATKNGAVLKLYSDGNMSLQAGEEASGIIYIMSKVKFSADHEIDFNGASLTGLDNTKIVAVFGDGSGA